MLSGARAIAFVTAAAAAAAVDPEALGTMGMVYVSLPRRCLWNSSVSYGGSHTARPPRCILHGVSHSACLTRRVSLGVFCAAGLARSVPHSVSRMCVLCGVSYTEVAHGASHTARLAGVIHMARPARRVCTAHPARRVSRHASRAARPHSASAQRVPHDLSCTLCPTRRSRRRISHGRTLNGASCRPRGSHLTALRCRRNAPQTAYRHPASIGALGARGGTAVS